MRTRMQQRFAEGLAKLAAGLTKPRGCKNSTKVMERLGRLRAKGLSYRWQTIRSRLATQMRVTVAMTNDKGERLVVYVKFCKLVMAYFSRAFFKG